MKFLFYRYNSICEPDMMAGLQALGHEVDTVELEMTNKNPTGEEMVSAIVRKIEQKAYDGMITVNYYPVISEICRIYQLPYLSWTVDCPVTELLSETIANPTNRIFCFDYAQYESIHKYHTDGVFYLPLATNTGRWDGVIASQKGRGSKWESDISFIGSLYTEKCPYDELKISSSYMQGYLEALLRVQKELYGAFILEEALTEPVIEEFCRLAPSITQLPQTFRKDYRYLIASSYLAMKVTSMDRLDMMKTLGKEFPVTIYTGSDTSGLPVCNKGFARTLTEMPLIFHCSKINLNSTCRAIRTGIPQRIWDIMGAGGFVLTNYQAELPEYFEIGKEIEIFGSMEELKDKCRFYRTHENMRREIAMRGYQKVKENHTYEKRMKEMLRLAFA